MKFLITLSLVFGTITTHSQYTGNISNSFEEYYKKSNPALLYSYDSVSQTHNYSNNWDFDKDGVKDKVYFIGKVGAHLYFYLRLILSSDGKQRDFKYIESDIPVLTATDTLNFNKTSIGFIVASMPNNATPVIIVRLDESTLIYNEKAFSKRRITTKNVLLTFKNRKVKFSCL